MHNTTLKLRGSLFLLYFWITISQRKKNLRTFDLLDAIVKAIDSMSAVPVIS